MAKNKKQGLFQKTEFLCKLCGSVRSFRFSAFTLTLSLFTFHFLLSAPSVFAVPPTPGYGSGAIGVDAANNLSVGTSTTKPETKLLIIASSSADTANYALKVLLSNQSPALVVRNDGNVGVGTTTPNAAAFTVQGNVYVSGNMTCGGSTCGGLIPADNVTAGVFNIGQVANSYAFNSSYLGVATTTRVGLPQALSVYGGGYFSGSVGIGTTGPGLRLDVIGGGLTLSGTAIRNLRAVQDQTNYRGIGLGYDTSGQIGVIYSDTPSAASAMAFWTYNGSAWGERMRIDTSGNVGIGDTSPATKLEVAGDTSSTRLCLGGTCNATWPASGGGTVTSITMGNGLSSTQSPLTTTGTMSVVYGSAANTAAQGNVTHTGPSVGLGLSGGGGALAVGTAGTFTTINLNMTGASCGAGTHMSFLSATGTGACTADTGGGAVPADNVTPGVFNSGQVANSYAFNSSYLGVATTTRVGLPQELSVYGGGYFSGNVGIGTTDPTTGILRIAVPYAKTDTSARNAAFFGSNEAVASNPFGVNIAVNGAAAIANRYVKFETTDYNLAAGGNLVFQPSGGNVGIGTSTPSDRLTISGGRVRIQDESNGADYAKLVVGTSGGLQAFHIGSYTNIPVAFYTNASGPRMVVDTSGNVGIGDTSPASLLSVGSGDLFQVNSSGNIIKINNVTYSWPSAQATAAGQVLTNNGAGTLTWVAPGGGVTSVFGRTGAVVAASGDYNTSLVTENGNLYFTNARAQAAITGGASSIVTSNLTASVALVSDASGKVAASAVTAANLGSINQNLGTGNSPTFANITATTKVTAQQWDPVYTISGTNYATYGLAMTGSKEETTGVVSVKCQVSSVKCSAVLDFKNAEKGSDLWLFYQATDFGKNMENLVALLTPSFDGRVWYEKDPAKNTLTIYATPTTYNLPPTTYEVSYRLTANRFDWQKWGNVSDDQTSGGLLVPEK